MERIFINVSPKINQNKRGEKISFKNNDCSDMVCYDVVTYKTNPLFAYIATEDFLLKNNFLLTKKRKLQTLSLI